MAALKLNKKLTDKLIPLIAAGNYVETACAACGIGRTSYYNWLKLAEETGEEPYLTFKNQIEEAQAQAEMNLLSIISTAAAMPRNWQAAAWVLERTRPDKYARKSESKTEISGSLDIQNVFTDLIKLNEVKDKKDE